MLRPLSYERKNLMIENRVRAALAAMPEIAQVQAQLQKTKKASLTGVSGGVRAAAASWHSTLPIRARR